MCQFRYDKYVLVFLENGGFDYITTMKQMDTGSRHISRHLLQNTYQCMDVDTNDS